MIPTEENSCAVVVTYFPDDDIISRLVRVQKQLPSIIIIDNASSENCLSVLRDFSASPTVILQENHENEGLGKALNQAAILARESGFLWMLTLDQDTVIHDDMFKTLSSIYESGACKLPLIGSNYWDVSRGKQFLACSLRSDEKVVDRRTVITSGTLVRLDMVEHIGGFREDYFIDSIDHEFSLRVRAFGNRVVMSCESLMSHSIGRSGSGGRLLLAFDHPPIRKYYMARNTLVTLKSYFWREPVWSLRQLARLMAEFLSIVLFERDKKNKGTAFGRGITDGLRNKMGRCEWPDVDT